VKAPLLCNPKHAHGADEGQGETIIHQKQGRGVGLRERQCLSLTPPELRGWSFEQGARCDNEPLLGNCRGNSVRVRPTLGAALGFQRLGDEDPTKKPAQ